MLGTSHNGGSNSRANFPTQGTSERGFDVSLDITQLRALGENAFKQYLTHGERATLDICIQSLRIVADRTSNSSPEKPVILTNFAVALGIRFDRFGSLPDLEEAITALTLAVTLTPDNKPELPSRLDRLGNCLRQRFENVGNPKDVEEAIVVLTRAVTLTPDGHADKPGRMNNLGTSLQRRYEHSGNTADLEKAIQLETRALSITPDSHTDKSTQLSNLGAALRARFERLGNLADLEEAITLWSRSVELTPKRHADKAYRLNNLGTALHERFERLGNIEDLEKAIKLQNRAVKLTPDSHPAKPTFLTNLGNSLQDRFEHVGNLEDVQQAITFHTRAAELTPERHPDKPSFLVNLSNSLRVRYERLGRLEDLQETVALQTKAVELIADEHTDKPAWLNNLGNSLREQFMRLGSLADLEKAIAYQTRAIELIATDHPGRPSCMSGFGGSLWMRYERVGNRDDLDKAIALQVDAVNLTPNDDPRKLSWMTNLSVPLHRRFERFRKPEDLEQVVTLLTIIVDLTPDDHPVKPARLSNLGNAIHQRYGRFGDSGDLQKAIALQTRAVKLTSDDHPDKPTRLCNLNKALLDRFDLDQKAEDLDEAIASGIRSVELLPKDHPDKAMALGALGHAYSTRLYSAHTQPGDLEHALRFCAEAMQEISGFPTTRLRAGTQYIKLLSHPSWTFPPPLTLLQAHEQVLDLIPKIIWLGNSVHRRYEELAHLGTIINTAAADAIAAGEYARALEWLESGRTVVWSQVLQLRTPLDALREKHPQLASKLESVSRALELASTPNGRADVVSEIATGSSRALGSLKDQATSSHTHALEYEKLVAQIRNLKGFESFLRPKSLAQLAPACSSGPVVVINVHETRCDALVLYHPDNIVHVPLPDFSYERAKSLRKQLWAVLNSNHLRGRSRDSSRDDDSEPDKRGPLPPGWKRTGVDPMQLILADLWKLVVSPILDVIKTPLESTTNNELPHITWCPTGPLVFLPIHAAGLYRRDGPPQTVMDHAVSSYTPTLETLLKPRARHCAETPRSPQILVVAQPETPGYRPIKATEAEATLVQSYFGKSTDTFRRSEGTVNTVLENMGSHDWVHLACHGVQSYNDPMSSSFILHDGELTLSMLMAKSFPRAELAVLSACQTATGDERLSEEAVHLAAGMLNVGYKSVIGTMWSIYDNSAPIVAGKFYEVMFRQVEAVGELQPAYALHEATKCLRQRCGEQDFVRWVPFVHFGL